MALNINARGFGLLGAAFASSIFGAAWYAARKRVSPAKLQALSAFLLAAALIVLAFTPDSLSASSALSFAGASAVVFRESNKSSIQLSVPDALRGRVLSVYFFLGSGSAPLSSLLLTGAMGLAELRRGLIVVTVLALVGVVIRQIMRRLS